jgi:nicotinamide mononucleotide transporter
VNPHDIVAAVNAPLLQVAGTPVSWAEAAGFVTGAWCVWLVAREHIANWPMGIANNVFFAVLFWAAGLYADAGLQGVYLALGAYGWWVWLRGGGRGALEVSRTPIREWRALAVLGVAGTAGLTLLLGHVTDSSVPFWDALTTSLSLLATYGQCRKRLESWWLWIAADVIYVPLYAYKQLYLTAGLYAVFLGLCVAGLLSWRSSLRRQDVLVAGLSVPA